MLYELNAQLILTSFQPSTASVRTTPQKALDECKHYKSSVNSNKYIPTEIGLAMPSVVAERI